LLAFKELAEERKINPTGFFLQGTLSENSFPPDILLFGETFAMATEFFVCGKPECEIMTQFSRQSQ
jgi:hypothetical protein